MMMRRRRWREEKGRRGYPGQPGGSRGHYSKIPLGPSCHFFSSRFMVLSSNKKLNNHIVEINKTPTSLIIWLLPRHQITCHSPPCLVCQKILTTVTFQESPACWWSMEPAVPWKYCKTDTWPSCWHLNLKMSGRACEKIHVVAGWDQRGGTK